MFFPVNSRNYFMQATLVILFFSRKKGIWFCLPSGQQVEDPNLTGITHLLVDEIHERGMDEDFLLIILRDVLPRRSDLRVILMSATINADLFSRYFGNAPTIHIPVWHKSNSSRHLSSMFSWGCFVSHTVSMIDSF